MNNLDVKSKLKILKEHIELGDIFNNIFFCESIANDIFKLLLNSLAINSLFSDIESDLIELVSYSIFISKFPRRLIKKGTSKQSGTQFEATICNILANSKIKIKILDLKTDLVSSLPDGSLQSAQIESKLETVKPNTWIVKNMRYKSSENKRSSRHRISEKSVINFVLNVEIRLFESTVHLIKNLYSDTVVIIVHSNQETDAQLTLFVDDYFRDDRSSLVEGRGFPCRARISAEYLIKSISDQFLKETNRDLSLNNCDYLLNKVRTQFQSEDILISDFIKRSMPQTKLSFGQWIVTLIRMCRIEHIQELWSNGLIEGFVSKDTENLLTEPGSFLLRFSERQAAIGVVLRSLTNEICAWVPFTEAECRKTNLANHLCDFATLITIRHSNGTFYQKLEVLDRFVDKKEVDDGYTARGSLSSQISCEDTATFDDTPVLDDIESMDDEDDFLEVPDDLDLDAIERECERLLHYKDS